MSDQPQTFTATATVDSEALVYHAERMNSTGSLDTLMSAVNAALDDLSAQVQKAGVTPKGETMPVLSFTVTWSQ